MKYLVTTMQGNLVSLDFHELIKQIWLVAPQKSGVSKTITQTMSWKWVNRQIKDLTEYTIYRGQITQIPLERSTFYGGNF